MKKVLILLLQTILALSLYSQSFVSKNWDARFGGIQADEMYVICKTNDGGFIAGGISMSGISGNKTQANRDATLSTDDYWIVKIDANGNYVWDKRYGGTGEDILHSLFATSDGGYILGGSSGSDNNGDKTEPSQGGFDYWVVKLDSQGNKQWDRRFGGMGDDFLNSVIETKDGGYVLAGNSNSGISGDKTQPNWDTTLFTADYWMVKIDSAGNKQWDRRFGTVDDDGCSNIIQSPDGGYLLGGTCPYPIIGGDKTKVNYANGDNFWVLKVDSVGNKQWDGVYGGTMGEVFCNSLNSTDNTYMLGGQSYDAVSGDKTTPDCGYWLVKIDTAGNMIGDWAYGSGFNCDQVFSSVSNTKDKGFLLTGTSGNVIGGDKTSPNLGSIQVWTIKIDSQMNRVWDRTAQTAGNNDRSTGALESSNGCYVIGVSTGAGIGGDKTQPDWGGLDYWVVEFCDSFPLGIQNPEGTMHLRVYPNPTSGDLYINIQKDNFKEASFTLTNTTGQIIYQSTSDHIAHSYTKILDLSRLPTGVYMLDVIVDGERIVKKVVKE